MNTFVSGEPGSGKTTGQIARIVNSIGKQAVLILDPQESLSFLVAKHARLKKRVYYDRLRRLDRGIPFISLQRSSLSGLEGEHENKEERMRIQRILLGRRGLKPEGSVLINEWLSNGLRLIQQTGHPLPFLPYCFQPWTPQFKQIVTAAGGDIALIFYQVAKFSRTQVRSELSPAMRVCEPFTDPSFIARCGGDLGRLIKEKSCLIFSGKGVNKETCRTLLYGILLTAIQYAEKIDTPMHIVVDEAENYGLITEDVLTAINTLRKQNVDITIITQTTEFEGCDKILQSCQRREYFKSGFKVAEIAANDLGTATYESNREWYREERRRQRHDGYQEIEGKLISQYVEEAYDVTHYMSADQQNREIAQQVMTLPVGTRLVNHRGKVIKETVKLLRELPWKLADKKTEKWIQTGAPEIKNSFSFSVLTPPPQGRSSEQESFPRTPLPADGL
ncbi:MAG: TraM recognition domain-containing protein [Candidatus Andersenbacteria bacterium]|nr:TraM recognition domain-containing protein [Candidatus Andersenbacteria bacterium]